MIKITGNETEIAVIRAILSEQYCPCITFEDASEEVTMYAEGVPIETVRTERIKAVGITIQFEIE